MIPSGINSGALVLLMILLYLVPALLIIYWMVKMLRNSNEHLKLNREILDELKRLKNTSF